MSETMSITGITAISTGATGKILNTGDTVRFTLALDNPVRVTTPDGRTAPTLSLSNGAVATHVATASTATVLVFDYTVAAGRDTGGTDTLKATAFNPNDAVSTAFGGFGQPETVVAPGAAEVALADGDGDGGADLVTRASSSDGSVSVRLGDGAGGFGRPETVAAPGVTRRGTSTHKHHTRRRGV